MEVHLCEPICRTLYVKVFHDSLKIDFRVPFTNYLKKRMQYSGSTTLDLTTPTLPVDHVLSRA
jgi:hypothetical protein